MKKVLLIAAAALIACSASAQSQSVKAGVAGKKAIVATPIQKKTASLDVNSASSKMTFFGDIKAKKSLSKKVAQSTTKLNSARKVGTIQKEYNAAGVSNGGERATWTMESGTLTTGELALINIIPSPAPSVLPEVPVVYTISGNIITIEPQAVFSDGDYDVYVCGYSQDDIIFTLGEDGSITFDDQIIYVAQDSENYDPTWETSMYTYGWYKNIRYTIPGQEIIPNASYTLDPTGMVLGAAINPDWNYWNILAAPVEAPVKFINTTDNFDSSEWNVYAFEEGQRGEVKANETTTDLVFTTGAAESYYTPELITSYEGNAGDPFQLGGTDKIRIDAGTFEEYYDLDSDLQPSWSVCDITQGLAIANTGGAKSVIAYQGKPAAPLYFEGISLQMYQFAPKDNFTMKCKIVKATRSASGAYTFGETIAESDVDLENIEDGANSTRLHFSDFYAYDEDGMSYGLDYIMIEDEFAVVFEGTDTDAADATYSGSVLCYSDEGRYTLAIISSEDEYSGYGWNSRRAVVGFDGFAYGYLKTDDSTELTFPEEGGSQTIHIEPMLSNSDGETMLFVDQNSEVPEWISLDIENESYTEDDWSFDLVVTAEPLSSASGAPRKEEAAGRTASFTLVQPGAKLDITVTQGAATGITDVKVTKTATDGKVYNVAGQRLNSNAKGLIVKDGKKYIVK